MKKLLTILLAVITCFSFVGCTPAAGGGGNDGPGNKPVYADDKEMMLLTYLPPKPSQATYQDYIDAGFNHILLNEETYWVEDEGYWNQYALAESMGLKTIMRTYDNHNNDNQPYAGAADDVCWLKDLPADRDVRDVNSLEAIYFWDEPNNDQIDEIARRVMPYYNANFANDDYLFFTNLFASYVSENAIKVPTDDPYYLAGSSAFENYIYKYCRKILDNVVGRKVLSFDHYPLRHNSAFGLEYFTNTWLSDLSIMSKYYKTVEGDCYFNNYIQAYGNKGQSGVKIPNCVGDIAVQVYTSFAFGAKSLDFYHYEGGETEPSMIVNNKKTDVYYYVQEVIQDFMAWDHVLLSFEQTGVKTFVGATNESGRNENFDGMAKYALEELPGVKSVSTRLDTLIGHLVDGENRNGYMIVNFDQPSNGGIDVVDITFDGGMTKALVYNQGEESIVDLADGFARIKLQPGQGAFVIPYK